MKILSTKGISPLIAAFLLVTVTVSIGVFLASWTSTIQQGQKRQAEKGIEELEKCGGASIEVVDALYDSGSKEITALVWNTGYTNLTNWKIDVYYGKVDMETKTPPDSDFVLSPGYKHPFSVTSAKTPQKIEVGSMDCPKQAKYVCNYERGVFVC